MKAVLGFVTLLTGVEMELADAEHRKVRGASEIDVTAWQERRAGTYTQ